MLDPATKPTAGDEDDQALVDDLVRIVAHLGVTADSDTLPGELLERYRQCLAAAGCGEPGTVYVPRGPGVVDRGSGIVGRLGPDGRLTVYFEGNRYGAANIVTWADRVAVAQDRLTQQYPTVARSTVPLAAMCAVGRFDGTRITVHPGAETIVARWLGSFRPGELNVSWAVRRDAPDGR